MPVLSFIHCSGQNFEGAIKNRDEERKLRLQYETRKKEFERRLKDAPPILREDGIRAVLTEITGIPLYHLSEETDLQIASIEKELSEVIIGQEDAVTRVANAIKRSMSEIFLIYILPALVVAGIAGILAFLLAFLRRNRLAV